MGLIQEAIKDAKQLRETAERNAHRRIVDALTPSVRRLIERQLQEDGDIDFDLEDLDVVADESEGEEMMVSDEEEPVAPEPLDEPLDDDLATLSFSADQLPGGAPKSTAPSVNVNASGDVDVNVEFETETEEAEEEDESLLTDVPMDVTEARKAVKLANRLAMAIDRGARDITMAERRKFRSAIDTLVEKLLIFNEHNILTEDQAVFNVMDSVTRLVKAQQILETNRGQTMRGKRIRGMKRLRETAAEMEELDELDAILTLDPADDEEAEMLGDLDLSDISVEIGGGEEEEGEEEEMELDFGDEGEEGEEGEDEEFEIEESVLRRELKRMRALRESDGVADFGAGTDEGEIFFNVSEEDLINVLADELGRADVATPKVESRNRRPVQRAQRPAQRQTDPRAARALAENKALRAKLAVAAKANAEMKRHLVEMNLFNAKLLYVNKLMQNKNVTPKQQRNIVEALDNAKTLREAKLLYKTLTESLNKRTALSESRVRQLGSPSRSTPSAQPATNGVETDRWAVLAGISHDEKA